MRSRAFFGNSRVPIRVFSGSGFLRFIEAKMAKKWLSASFGISVFSSVLIICRKMSRDACRCSFSALNYIKGQEPLAEPLEAFFPSPWCSPSIHPISSLRDSDVLAPLKGAQAMVAFGSVVSVCFLLYSFLVVVMNDCGWKFFVGVCYGEGY